MSGTILKLLGNLKNNFTSGALSLILHKFFLNTALANHMIINTFLIDHCQTYDRLLYPHFTDVEPIYYAAHIQQLFLLSVLEIQKHENTRPLR